MNSSLEQFTNLNASMVSLAYRRSLLQLTQMSRVMRKQTFCKCENKDADQHFCNFDKLISAFVFAPLVEQSLCFLNPKVQVSGHLLYLYSLVCVGPGRNPEHLSSTLSFGLMTCFCSTALCSTLCPISGFCSLSVGVCRGENRQ